MSDKKKIDEVLKEILKEDYKGSVTRSRFEIINDKLTVNQIEALSENLLNGFE